MSSDDLKPTGLDAALLRLATEFLNLPDDETLRGIEKVLSVVGEFTEADCSGVSEFDRARGSLRELYTWSRPGFPDRRGTGEAIEAGPLAELFGDFDCPVLVMDARVDSRLPDGYGEAFAQLGMRALAWVPISSTHDAIAAVGLTSADVVEWTETHVELLRIAGKIIANLRARSTATSQSARTETLLEDLARSIEHHFFIWAVDPPHFVYSNDVVEKLTGRSVEILKKDPQSFLDNILPEYRESFATTFAAGLRGPSELDYRLRRADGQVRWLRTRLFPGGAQHGKGLHIAGLTEDVTDRVERAECDARLKEFEALMGRVAGRLMEAPFGEMDHVIGEAAEHVARAAGVEMVSVYSFDSSRKVMRLIARWHGSGELLHGEELESVPAVAAPYCNDRFLSSQPIIVSTPDELPESAMVDRAFLRRHGVRSCAMLPLMAGARPIGSVVLTTLSEERRWSEEDRAILKVAAETIAAAVDRRGIQRDQENRSLFERLITSLVSEFMNLPASDLDRGIDRAIEKIARFVGCDRAAIYIIDEEGREGRMFRGWWAPGVTPIVGDHDRISVDLSSPYGEWIRSGEPHLVLSAATLETLRPDAVDRLSRSRLGAVANVPMVIDGRRIGWFGVAAALPRVDWNETELRWLAVGADALVNMYSRRLDEEDRQRHRAFEELLSDIAADFIKRPISEIRPGIEEVVARFGSFARCDRAAILLIDREKRTASTYYEWIHRGIPAPVVDFPIGDAPRFYEELVTSEGPWTMHVEKFPPSDKDAGDVLASIGIRTLLNCPIRDDGQVFGYASIGYPESNHRPLPGTEKLLEVAAGIVANALARERLEKQAIEQHEKLSKAFRLGSLAQLATGIAHELNQPLTAIANYTRACVHRLDSQDVDRESLSEILARVSNEAIRAGDIVRHLRAHVRAGPGERKPSSVRKIVDHARELLAGTGNDKGVKIVVDYEADLPDVHVEATEIEQVVINVVQNSIDSLVACESEPRQVRISVAHARPFVEISIIDSGPGFPKQDAKRLFDEFYTTKPGGLGLGLSIGRELIESNDGTISAEVTPDGPLFRIRLPVAPAGARGRSLSARPRSGAGQSVAAKPPAEMVARRKQ